MAVSQLPKRMGLGVEYRVTLARSDSACRWLPLEMFVCEPSLEKLAFYADQLASEEIVTWSDVQDGTTQNDLFNPKIVANEID